jgi:ribosomal protein S18 acetylase RimI-like enzyme
VPDANSSVTIRAVEQPDAGSLAELMTQLGYPTRLSEMQMRLEAVAGDARYRTFVAIDGGRVCGMIGTFALCSYEHNDPGGRILALIVDDAARRRGVGRRLVRAAENDFAQRNITRIALDTRFEREEAHRFYTSIGYRRNGFRFVKELAAAAD